MQDEKRCEAYTNRSLEVSQAEVISAWTVPLNRLHCCRSSPGWNRANLLPLLPGVTQTLNTWKAVASGRAFSAHSACEQIFWYEADCDARARLCEASARAWECCSDLQPAPSRLGMKMCHIPFHAPFQIPFSPSFTAHLWGEQCCYFYGVRTWTCCQRRKVVLSSRFAISQWTSHLPEKAGDLLSRHTLV